MPWVALLAAILAVGARAVPTGLRDGGTCSLTCSNDNEDSSPLYQQGLTYVYSYQSDVETKISGSSDEASRLHVTAKVHLTSNGACDLQIQLVDVALKDSHPKEVSSQSQVENMALFKQQLEQKPLKFSYQNGLADHICAAEDEDVWVLNFKRAVISMIVNGASHSKEDHFESQEVDISGECNTKYTVDGSGDNYHVTKVKNLLTCKNRGHLISSLQTTPYASSSSIQSLPILASTLKCYQKVEYGRVVNARCREHHQFRPFSGGQQGAVTVTNVRWQEEEVLTSVVVAPLMRNGKEVRLSPTFDTRDPEFKQTNDVESALNLIDQLDEKTVYEVRPEAPRLFVALVTSMRHMDYDSIKQFQQALISPSQRKYFVDALPMVGTAASMALMRDFILSNQVGSEESDRWLTSLAFVHEPSLSMIEELHPLVKSDSSSKQALLGISSLLHQYCEKNPLCIEEDSVRKVIAALEYQLPTNCYARSEEEVFRTIVLLKSIGNIGRTVTAGDMLKKCIEFKENPIELRLAAVNAFNRMSCTLDRRDALLDMLSNEYENTEIRIAAYLSLMKCPNYYVIEKVGDFLSKEPVNQVSSFVWTHLTNIKESDDPTKQNVKSMLNDMNLKKKFKTDIRKFSRYFEKSTFVESMNTGASIEGAVVFSPDSYIPRSAMMNITFDLFGEAINLLEVGGRLEGMDNIFNDYFGAGSYLPTKTISNLWSYFISDSGSNGLVSEVPKASSYVKVFGNELSFNKYSSIEQFTNLLSSNSPLNFLKYLAEEKDWTDNINFLDSSYIVSTIAGFPFSLRALGSASISLKTKGDYRLESWSQLTIDGYLKPSASVEVVGEMGVDAFVARTGLKMTSNFHTSSVVDGSLKVNGGNLVSAKINMPKNKIEIFDVKTRFYSIYKNKMNPMTMNSNKYQNRICSGATTEHLLGLNFCTNLQYPTVAGKTPEFLLAGPIDAQVYIEKSDAIEAFEFEFSHLNQPSEACQTHLSIDAPGGAIDRRISFDLKYLLSGMIEAKMHTPFKAVDVYGSLQLESPTKAIEAQILVDKTDKYAMEAKYTFDSTGNGWTFEPKLVIIGISEEMIHLEGGMSADYTGTYGLGATLRTPLNTPIIFKVEYKATEDRHLVEQSLYSSWVNLDQTAFVRFTDTGFEVHTETEFARPDSEKHIVVVNAEIDSQQQESQKVSRLDISTQVSSLPFLDTELAIVRTTAPGKCHTRLTLLHNDKTYMAIAAFKKHDDSIGTHMQFTAQHWGVDAEISGDIDLTKAGVVKFDGITRLTDVVNAVTKLTIHSIRNDLGFHYGLDTELKLPKSKYQLAIGARREIDAAHIKFVAARDIAGKRDEVNLVALLALEEKRTDLEVTMFVPHLPRVQVFATLSRGQDDVYAVGAGTTYGDHVYQALVEYRPRQKHQTKIEMQCPGHKLEAVATAEVEDHEQKFSVDVQCGRRVMATLLTRPFGDSITGKLEIYLNKNVDDSQLVNIDLIAKRSSRKFSGSIKYPGNQCHLSGQLRNDGVVADLEFAPSQTIHMELSALTSGLAQVEFKGLLTTPFDDYRHLSLTLLNRPEISNSRTENKLVNFQMATRWNDQLVEMDGYVVSEVSTNERHSLHAVLNLNTPYKDLEKVHFDTTVYAEGGMYSARAAASVNMHSFGIGVLHKFSVDMGHIDLRSELDLKLPLYEVKVVKLRLFCQADESQADGEVVALWETDTSKQISIKLSTKNGFPSTIYHDTTIILTTPFYGHEEYYSRALFKWLEGDYALLLTSQNVHGEKLYHTELSYRNENYKKLQSNFEVALHPFESMGLSFDSSFETDNSRINLETFWGQSNFSIAMRESSLTPLRNKIEIGIKTPSGHRYGMTRNLEMIAETKTYVADSLLYFDENVIQMDVEGSWQVIKSDSNDETTVVIMGRGGISTPFPGWEMVNFTNKATINMTDGVRILAESMLSVNDLFIRISDKATFQNLLQWNGERLMESNTQYFKRFYSYVQMESSSFSNSSFHALLDRDGKKMELSHSQLLTMNENDSLIQIRSRASCNEEHSLSFELNGSVIGNEVITLSAIAANSRGTSALTMRSYIREMSSSTHALIESPFFEKIVLDEVENITDNIEYQLNVSYGLNDYSIKFDGIGDLTSAAKLIFSVKSPESVFGDISLHTDYNVSSEITLKSGLNINGQVSTVAMNFSSKKGEIKVKTPLPKYRHMSAVVNMEDEAIQVIIVHEQRKLMLTTMRTNVDGYDGVYLQLSTPFEGFETVSLKALKHVQQHDYKVDYERGYHDKLALLAKDSGNKYYFYADASSESMGRAKLDIKLNLEEKVFGMKIQRNDEELEILARLSLDQHFGTITLSYNSSFMHGPRKIALKGTYMCLEDKNKITILLVKNSNNYKANFEHETDANNYSNQLRAELSKNSQVIKARANFDLSDRQLKIDFHLKTPFKSYEDLQLISQAKWSDGKYNAHLTYNVNTVVKSFKVSFVNFENYLKITAQTPCHYLRNFAVEYKIREFADTNELEATFSRNEDYSRLKIQRKLTLLNTQLLLSLETPYETLKSISLKLSYDLKGTEKSALISMNKNEQSLFVRFDSQFSLFQSSNKLSIETPFEHLRSMKFNLMHDLSGDEKQFEVYYERNGKVIVLASRGAYKENEAYVDLITPFYGYEKISMHRKYSNRRGKREVSYEAAVDGEGQKLSVFYERKGLDSVHLRVETPIEQFKHLEAQLNIEKTDNGWTLRLNTDRNGNKCSGVINLVGSTSSMELDIEGHTYLSGWEDIRLSGNLVYEGPKKSFTLKSTQSGQSMEVSGELETDAQMGRGNLKMKTPIPNLEDVNAEFKYNIDKEKSIDVTITRNGVSETFKGTLTYDANSFEANLETPIQGLEKLHAKGKRNKDENGKINAELMVSRNDRQIDLKYDYKRMEGSAEANLEFSSPYESIKTIMMHVNYEFNDESRLFKLYLKRNDRVWDIEIKRHEDKGEDNLSISLLSPIDSMKSIHISSEADFHDSADFEYELNYERNGKNYSLEIEGGMHDFGQKLNVNAEAKTPSNFQLAFMLNYDITSEDKTVKTRFSIDDRFYDLQAQISSKEGNVKLQTTNSDLSQVIVSYRVKSFELYARDIEADITMPDGSKSIITYKADYTKDDEAGGNIKLQCPSYGDHELYWHMSEKNSDLAGEIKYTSEPLKIDVSGSMEGKGLEPHKIVLKSSVVSDAYTSTRSAYITYHLKKGLKWTVNIDSNGQKINGDFEALPTGNMLDLKVVYDGIWIKNLKINGGVTIPETLEGRKNFKFDMTREGRQTTLDGFVNFGTSIKSGSMEFTLETPLELLKSLKMESNWDMIDPNTKLNIDYRRNDRHYIVDLSGTRFPGKQDLNIQIVLPNDITIFNRKLNKISIKASYDLTKEIKFMLDLIDPFQAKIDLAFKNEHPNSNIDLTYTIKDSEENFLPWVDERDIKLHVQRTHRPQGPKLDIIISTNYKGFENIELHSDLDMQERKLDLNYKRDDKIVKISGKMEGTPEAGSVHLVATSSIEGFESVSLDANFERIPGDKLSLDLDYKRGSMYLKLNGSGNKKIQRSDGKLEMFSVSSDMSIETNILKDTKASMSFEIDGVTQPERKMNINLSANYNNKKFTLKHNNMMKANYREEQTEIAIPYKNAQKKFQMNSKMDWLEQTAEYELKFGEKKIKIETMWFSGKKNEYGFHVKAATPFKEFELLELDMRATMEEDHTVALRAHYRRQDRMIHVTGTAKPYEIQLDVESPFGDFKVEGGVAISREEMLYSVKGKITLDEGGEVGGEITVKAKSANDMQLTIDILTPIESWSKLSTEIAFTNNQQTRLIKLAFESPLTKRFEIGLVFTNLGTNEQTDVRTSVTSNYLGKEMTIVFSILRNPAHTLLKMDIQSPFPSFLPSMTMSGRI